MEKKKGMAERENIKLGKERRKRYKNKVVKNF